MEIKFFFVIFTVFELINYKNSALKSIVFLYLFLICFHTSSNFYEIDLKIFLINFEYKCFIKSLTISSNVFLNKNLDKMVKNKKYIKNFPFLIHIFMKYTYNDYFFVFI